MLSVGIEAPDFTLPDQNGEYYVTSECTYTDNGYCDYAYNEDGSLHKSYEVYEIPLPIPSVYGGHGGYETISLTRATFEGYCSDYFTKDDQGRVNGVIRRFEDDGSEIVQAKVEYDELGRIISQTEDTATFTFLYDENGNLVEEIKTDAETGKVVEGRIFEYSEIVVPIS